ncbi:MAG TPA: YciI family protein [Streptosporangiaceae bacterium]|nr:YciI family protein [Streptosporangiaceae bacterium]
MKYVLFVCVDRFINLSAEQRAELPAAVEGWVSEMESRGIRQFGQELEYASDATTVRVRGDELLVADGPFAETKEQIGGFDVLECADLDEAIEVAAKHPVAKFGTLEIRPFRQA